MEIFSKFLTETDLSHRLTIQSHALAHFERFEGQRLVVADWCLGTEWRLRFSTRNKGHARPVFTGEWLKFVEAKNLQLRDLLIFVQLEDGRYKIEVLRETDASLLGEQVIWRPVL